jgi:hypothetical protein
VCTCAHSVYVSMSGCVLSICECRYVDAASGVGTADKALEGDWTGRTVADLKPKMPFTVLPTVSCKEAVDILSGEGFDQLPVVRCGILSHVLLLGRTGPRRWGRVRARARARGEGGEPHCLTRGGATCTYTAALWGKQHLVVSLAAAPHTAVSPIVVRIVCAVVVCQVSADNAICGVVTEGNLTSKLMSGRVKPSDPVTSALYDPCCLVHAHTPRTRTPVASYTYHSSSHAACRHTTAPPPPLSLSLHCIASASPALVTLD